jgi:hypothetical protein
MKVRSTYSYCSSLSYGAGDDVHVGEMSDMSVSHSFQRREVGSRSVADSKWGNGCSILIYIERC